MVMDGDSILGGECRIQYTDDILQNYTLETYIFLLTNGTAVNSIEIFYKQKGISMNRDGMGEAWTYLLIEKVMFGAYFFHSFGR